jgi:hypothetical protein
MRFKCETADLFAKMPFAHPGAAFSCGDPITRIHNRTSAPNAISIDWLVGYHRFGARLLETDAGSQMPRWRGLIERLRKVWPPLGYHQQAFPVCRLFVLSVAVAAALSRLV